MSDNQSNNKRIAKNTILLYGRTMILMVISLYTSRLVLQALGASDFGLYNVVGGFVMMFTMLSGSLTAACSRFITFDLGKGNKEKLNRTFSATITIQFILAFLIVIVMETFGLWFLNNKMMIPEGREITANFVFQFSILSFCIQLISVPYNALITAHEKMSTFAYIGLLEGAGKLLIAYVLLVYTNDRLLLYSILTVILSSIIRFIYGAYCKRHFEESVYHFVFDKALLKNIFSFAGWNLIGSATGILMTQGVNVITNMFFGVLFNTARGVAASAESMVMQFVGNFTTAINPQITKSYAKNDKQYLYQLMFKGTKYSYYLVLLFALPFIIEAETVLRIWLGEVPANAALFMRLTLGISLVNVLSNTMVTAMLATGNIKKYQIVVGSIAIFALPLTLFAFYMGYPAYIAYIIQFIIVLCLWISRQFLLKQMIDMDIKEYHKQTTHVILPVTVLSCIIPIILKCYLPVSLFSSFVIIASSVTVTLFFVYTIGITATEKQFIVARVHNMINKVAFRRKGK